MMMVRNLARKVCFTKINVTLFFIVAAFVPHVFSVNVDSLKNLVRGTQGSRRIILLNKIAEACSEEFPENTISYASEALVLSQAEKNRAEEAKALKNLGDAAITTSNFTEARGYFERSAVIEEELNGKESRMFIDRTADIGYCYLMTSRYEDALGYFQQAANLAQQSNYLEEVANNLSNIATIYVEWGDYAEAVDCFAKVLTLDKKAGIKDKISTDLNNIGKMYELLGNYDQAIDHYRQALVLEMKTGKKARIAVRLNNLGTALKAAGKYDEALKYLQQALEIEQSLGNTEKVGKRLHHIGNTYFAMGQFDRSLVYFNQAFAIYDRMDLKDELARLYNSFGNLYLALKDNGKATEYLLKSQELAVLNKLKPLQASNLKSLSEAYAAKGEYHAAFEAMRNLKALEDSVFSKESEKKLAEFRARFENEKFKLENEVLRKEAESKRKTNLLIGITLSASILILLSLVFIFRLRARNARQEKAMVQQRAEQYRKDLEFRNRELAFNAMNIIRSNEAMSEMVEKVKSALNDRESIKGLYSVLINTRNASKENSWKEFEVRFTQVHKEFYDVLNLEFPDLTPNEKKLCAFLRLNMTTKDIASITHQSVQSINVARTRLRKKMNLANSDENLVNFLMKF
jgi:tetratricopeptide (TPR) repeat protein